jgi:hypothetical protein
MCCRDPEGNAAKKITALPNVVAKRIEEAFDQPIDRYFQLQDFAV